jgi:hypothetical protein
MTIFDDIEDVAEDVVDAAGSVVGDLVDAGSDLFEGPGGLVGIAVAGGSLFVMGPGAVIPAFVAGSVAGNLLIKHRPISSQELAFAGGVFGNTLPPRDRIILTNLERPDGRKFTCPNAAGQILVNLGEHFNDPVRRMSARYPAPGKLFITSLRTSGRSTTATFCPG